MFTIQNKNRTISVVIILAMVLSLAPVNPARAATLTQSVTTIAGNGLATFSGDGGPATAAALNSPPGVAVAADGTVYVADSGNFRIRRISPGGVISTIAGNGTYGDSGDGGQATAAELGSIEAIALSPADDILYISDNGMNRVRQVDLGSGVISTFAGRGLDYIGHEGNGGPATDAWIGIPLGIAVDPAGNVYFIEFMYCTVRKVDIATHVITRVAGSGLVGDCASDGDGGDALAARLSSPNNVATDAAGNLFLIETATDTVRRIDAGTHIITTVAGGGITPPGFGDATTMALGDIEGLAIDDADNLYVSNFSQVFKVDLGTGILSVFAGTGANGFSGDGGPALDATFSNIWGLDIRGDALFIADSNNNRIRAVVPPPLPDDLIIELATSQALLDSLTAVPGSILMINVDGREYLLIPNATSVGLDVTLTGNDQLIIVDLGALQSVGGSITISGNLAMQSIDLSSLATVDGSLTITGNPALNVILISGVTSIGGDLTVVGTAATVIDASSLTTVVGSLDISDNMSATAIDASSLASVGGDLTVTGNTAATVINAASLTTVGGNLDLGGNTSVGELILPGLTTVGGDLSIDGATAATSIDASALATVGGSLSITNNPVADPIDASSLTTVAGDLTVSGNISVGSLDLSSLISVGSLDISGNTSVNTIDASGLTSVGGDLIVVDNGDAAVDMSAGTDVGGDLTVETTGTGSFSMGDGTVTGDATVDATGYTDMSGTTPGGSLDLTATRVEAVMHLQVQAATFTTPVSFSVTRVDPVALAPESGLDDGGGPATIDPVAAYQFDFAVPTLDRDASLSFDIVLAQLAAATRTALLDALAAGNVTMVTKGDAAGSAFQAFPICAGAQTSTADGCVRIETFDALGQPTSGTPAIIRFSNVVGHFSTWAVAIVTPMPQADLSVTKSDSADPVTVGEEFRYTVVVTNNGPDAAENVILNDTLPAGTSFVFDTITQGACASGFPLLQCQIGTMNSGGTVTLTFRVTPSLPGVITNAVSVTSDTADPDASNNSDSEETVVTQLNTVPTVSVVSGYCFSNVLASGMVYLSLSDADENPLSLTFDSNTNPALIPNGSIMVAGKENIRAISLMAKFMKSGTATLTFNLSDGTVTIPFTITVKVGTARDETLNGTEGADMIFGLNGKDIINGFGGNDLLCGGNGIDTIGGGDGNDFIDGQNGDDLLIGGNDNDILLGRFGNDVLTGGSGFDFFSGGAGVDTATDFNAGEGDTQNGTIP